MLFTFRNNSFNKPFFLGEIGIKAKSEGNSRTPVKALEIMESRLKVYKDLDISGALLWGPQPLGNSPDGHGYGFDFGESFPERMESLKQVYQVFSND